MLYFDLDIELLEDCVFSERRATFGMPRSLDYVPGAKLMGAAAAKLYRSLENRAFDVFHSGHVRFGNGLPVGEAGDVGYPMPICWHVPKHEEESVARPGGRRCLDPNRVRNAQHGLDPHDRQLRTGFVTESGEWLRPARRHAAKTAHRPGTNKAEEGRLFGYDALVAGQRFRSRVAISGDDCEILEMLRKALATELRLGRSRSAEFGSVRCTAGEVQSLHPASVEGKQLTLWLVSDLAARDGDGAPSLAPLPQWLGLPEGRLLARKSFLRTRRYSPYNTHWRAPEAERQVIERGSVLAFELDCELDADERARLAFGIGEYVSNGLGQVLCNHPLLAGPRPSFADLAYPGAPAAVEVPETGIGAWLEREGQRSSEARIQRWLEAALRRWCDAMGEAQSGGPGHSQWSRVAELAEGCADVHTLRVKLFQEQGAPCRANDSAWGRMIGATTYEAWLRAEVDRIGPEREIPPGHAIGALARAIRDRLAKRQ